MERLRGRLPLLIVYGLIALSLWGVNQRFTPIRVAGGSMRPALQHGDVVVVERDSMVQRGQIVLVRSGGSLFLHRVKQRLSDGALVTRGDANPVDDFEAASKEDVVGQVVAVVPVSRLLQRWRQ